MRNADCGFRIAECGKISGYRPNIESNCYAEREEIELWIELSTDEQLYRLGRQLAQAISASLRPERSGPNVWVMYRVVPLSHAFLNGEARSRGTATLD